MTVVVAVYNALPYLRRCLASLRRQGVAPEVVAVDDGSTDGSAETLDRWARKNRKRPGVTVVHQENSGGPAAPNNRALGLARGRYVFFLGADDFLAPLALQRLVERADELRAGVMIGRIAGVNSRTVDQSLFERDDPALDLFASRLPTPWPTPSSSAATSSSATGLRFAEDMPVCSDQPFTLAACLHARRIAVRADAVSYFAVRRLDAKNITYSSRNVARIEAVERLMTPGFGEYADNCYEITDVRVPGRPSGIWPAPNSAAAISRCRRPPARTGLASAVC